MQIQDRSKIRISGTIKILKTTSPFLGRVVQQCKGQKGKGGEMDAA